MLVGRPRSFARVLNSRNGTGGARAWLASPFAACLGLCAAAAHADCVYSTAATFPLTSQIPPTVNATVNGAHVLFLVDTGAEVSTVTPDTVLSLQLRQDRRRRTILTTVDGKETRQNVIIQELGIADLKYGDRSVAVAALRHFGGLRPPAGILGADILSDFDIEVDMPRRLLTFYHMSGCQFARPPWTGRYQTLRAITTHRGRLLFPIDIEGHPFTALFDTGADRVLLSHTAAESLGVTEAALALDAETRITSGGGASTRVRQHVFGAFRIGDEVFHNKSLSVSDVDILDADLLVGAPYMTARRFLLSYSTNALFVQREQSVLALHDAVLPPPVPKSKVAAAAPPAPRR